MDNDAINLESARLNKLLSVTREQKNEIKIQ